MGNMFGSAYNAPSDPNFVASGQGVYISPQGVTVHDSFRHVNGQFTRETTTNNLPSNTGFIQPQQPGQMPWMVPVAAMVMLSIVAATLLFSRRGKQSMKQAKTVTEDAEKAIPLYSLTGKHRPPHASDAMWNIDLLDD